VLRVNVKDPDGLGQQAVDLPSPGTLLVGRAPDPLQLGSAQVAPAPVQVLTVSAPSVSANHVAVLSTDSLVTVQDMESRNGTWLLLPRGQSVRLSAKEVTLHLAHKPNEAVSSDEPATPAWSGKTGFATAISHSIAQWLRNQGVDVAIEIRPRGDDRIQGERIPLATGESLEINLLATTDGNWSRRFERLWRWVAQQNGIYETEEQTREEGMILASPAIRAAHRDVVAAARAGARTLLLTGPSGAGKEMLAEVFHRHSGRNGPFVAVNCSMFSKELLRSELFGAEAGAFTGAIRRIVGAVERAQGGTLLLDELGEMPPEVQPMLLRFLDRCEYDHVGQQGRVQRADVRVVAATNKDLREAARSGSFRVDLWYRLSIHVVEVPPLRARWDDVVAFLESVSVPGKSHSLFSVLGGAALEVLRTHPWEGNFRELTNFTHRLLADADRGPLDAGACRRSLERGAIRAISDPVAVTGLTEALPDWSELARRAVHAFIEDRGREPRNWDDQKEWNEKYLKPLLFFHLSGAASFPTPHDAEGVTALSSRIATRVQADRGTAAKQLARYFERFGGGNQP
jgi:DNA-binding NtrC family response regulator